MSRFKSYHSPLITQMTGKKDKGFWSRHGVFLAIVMVVSIILDQGLKAFVQKKIALGELYTVTFFLDWTHVWNKGISFGMFPCASLFSRIILGGISCLFIGFLFVLYRQSIGLIQRLGSALMISGAISNGIDRIVYQGVFDFIRVHWGSWDFPVFNLADMLISMGFLALLSEHFEWNALRFQKKRR